MGGLKKLPLQKPVSLISHLLRKGRMSTFHAVVLGKLGVGKSTLINDIFQKEMAQTSAEVGGGCTKGVKCYEGVAPPLDGKNIKIYDSEGTFGIKDNLGEVVSTVANQLAGQPLHMMMVCISVKHISRVDLDTMSALKIAGGIAGEKNVDKLVVVWTQAESAELQQRAKDCMTAVRETIT